MQCCVSSFQHLIPWIEWSRSSGETKHSSWGGETALSDPFRQQGKHAVGLHTEGELVLLNQIYADCNSKRED